MNLPIQSGSVVARSLIHNGGTILLLTILFSAPASAQAPAERPGTEPDHPAAIALWPNGTPGFEDKRDEKEVVVENGSGRSSFIAVSNVHNPTITPYVPAPDKATGIAVVVAPGGGHRLLAISHEGYNVGQWLADHGIAAFVHRTHFHPRAGNTPAVRDCCFRHPGHPSPVNRSRRIASNEHG